MLSVSASREFDQLKDDNTSNTPAAPGITPKDGLPKISVPSIPKIPKIGAPKPPNIPVLKVPSKEPLLVMETQAPTEERPEQATSDEVDMLPEIPFDEIQPITEDGMDDLPMLKVMPLDEHTEAEIIEEIIEEHIIETPAALNHEVRASAEAMESVSLESTMLESESAFIGDPNLDDFEEGDATMVFDSMSGIDLKSVQSGKLDVSGMAPGPSIQQEEAQAALNWDSGAPALGTPSQAGADDFTAQATEILQSPFEQDLVTPKLKFISGPVQGQESFVSGLVATFGRGEQNTMMVADLAMSRNHFEVARQPDESFIVRDLGSANGTSLNGTPIKEAALYHGDRLEAGKSTMVFEAPHASPKAQRYIVAARAQATLAGIDQPTPMNDLTSMATIQIDQTTRFFTRISIGAAVVCVPLIATLLFLSMRSKQPASVPPVSAQLEQLEGKKQAADLYLSGVESVKSREWDQAQKSFESAKTFDPTLNIKPQLDLLERERSAQKAFAKAQALVAEQKQDEVNAIVNTIPPDSVYADEAYKLKRQQLRDDLEGLYKTAQAKFTEENLEDSKRLAQQVIERSPEHEGAKALLASIATRQADIDKAVLAASTQNPSANAPNPFDATTRTATAPQVDAGAEHIKQGIALYRRGKFEQAVQSFNASSSSKAKKYVRHVTTFKSAYPAGKSAIKKKQWSKAISQLERARRADRLVSNSYKKQLAEMLSQAHGQKGLESIKSGKYRNARTSYITGKRYGNSPSIRELNQTLESKAKSLYIKAASLKRKDPDQAGLLCRKIMLMVPTSSPTWKKAQRVMMDF